VAPDEVASAVVEFNLKRRLNRIVGQEGHFARLDGILHLDTVRRAQNDAHDRAVIFLDRAACVELAREAATAEIGMGMSTRWRVFRQVLRRAASAAQYLPCAIMSLDERESIAHAHTSVRRETDVVGDAIWQASLLDKHD